ncbi:MAG: carbamoyltransferase HypF [candidate division WOR-3 bacterium]
MKVQRLKVEIEGFVQGVGFRPFVYRIAKSLNLKGFVKNTKEGVLIEVEGKRKEIEKFLKKLKDEKPPLASYHFFNFYFLDKLGYKDFKILKSDEKGKLKISILPDIATCKECIHEIFDKNDRRYLYPFTNCTNCGPRFSIIEKLPYDRKNTTMKVFKMCKDCEKEYDDPMDRRFHAQPNACPLCGPKVYLYDENKNLISEEYKAIKDAVNFIKNGFIIALKGIGGYQLLCDAFNDEAVKRLRERKKREEKPFAVMFPSLKYLKEYVYVDKIAEIVLTSPSSPILLLKKKENKKLSEYVAPSNPYLGVFLPYSPLHHILMKELNIPVICTSGNISDEPIVFEDEEVFKKLKGIADYFLIHNRRIKRYVDDSVVKIVLGKEYIIRRARGYAPAPIIFKEELPKILAVGGHLKNTIAISKGRKIFISQHIGDLEKEESYKGFLNIIDDFKKIFEFEPDYVAHDAHPEYLSTKYAKENYKNLIPVYHHHAHIVSCMVDNEIDDKVLGISWDGTGYGKDGKIWGGEFLICNYKDFERIGTFREFKLIGGDKAIKEPRRSAIGVLYEIFKEKCFDLDLEPINSLNDKEKENFKIMLEKNINTFYTTSSGRIFDAVSSILGIKQRISYEGQAAMMLEWVCDEKIEEYYNFEIKEKNGILIFDWEEMFEGIINDLKNGIKKEIISSKFHNTLVEVIYEMANKVKIKKIFLSGGVFQNKILLEKTYKRLSKRFEVYIHQRIPANDNGISLGQIIIASRKIK